MNRLTQRVARDLGEIAASASVAPDAIESIRQRIAVLAEGSPDPVSDVVGPGAPPTRHPGDRLPIGMEAERARRGGSRRRLVWAGAVVAVLALIVGMVVVTRDDQQGGLETVDVPDREAQETTTTTTTPPAPADPWAFEVTYVEVDAGHAVAANDEFAWVAGTAAPVLSKIDLATNEVVSVTAIPPGAGVANFGFGSVWINYSDGRVLRFDPETEVVVATIDVGGQPSWIEPGIDSMWLGTGSGGEVVRIDPATDTVAARIDVGGSAGAVGENESGVWVTNNADLVTRIDPATNAVVATIDVDGSSGLMVSPDAVWTPGGITELVYRIDPATNSVSAEIDISAEVDGSAVPKGVHFAGGTVWVRFGHDCDRGDCTQQAVVRIDPDTNEVVATADLREGWRQSGMSVGPSTAWTFDDDAVARFDFADAAPGG